jgi:glycosyltransferase involved in cell wall biosynthesis
MTKFSVAICSYNRAQHLPPLIEALRAQNCPVPFDILVVDNNSSDATYNTVDKLIRQNGAQVRYVNEPIQGITYARNRAISECLSNDYLAYIDDDELPLPGWLEAGYRALHDEGAACVGGRIMATIPMGKSPEWLTDELLGFLGQLDYGAESFWITGPETPIWSGNIAYRMSLFRDNPILRFDARYNRAGSGVGGGEDAIMFRTILNGGARIRYRPDMAIEHIVDPWKLRRSYFLKLHYLAGLRSGRYQFGDYKRLILGVPPFLITQFFRQCSKTVMMSLQGKAGILRQAMNAANALGNVIGYAQRNHNEMQK